MQTVDLNEAVPLISYWWDEEGNGAEPSAITLTITAPDGTQTVKHKGDLTSVKTAPDVLDTWLWSLTITQVGVWRFTFLGTVDSHDVEQSGMLLAGEDLSREGACEPWCSWGDVEALCSSIDLSAITLGQRESLLDLATDILYRLDGKHYPGVCATTRRVCRSCGTCGAPHCSCGVRSTVDLGRSWPVVGVWDVVVEGVTLPTTAYQLRDHRFVDRIDGESWPVCSDVTDPDAFTMSYAYGRRPPRVLRDACAVFAAEMAKSCVGVACELPSRVTSITREGVSYTILDSQKFLDEGRVGIYRVDLALAAAKMGRKPRPGGWAPYGQQTRTSRVS